MAYHTDLSGLVSSWGPWFAQPVFVSGRFTGLEVLETLTNSRGTLFDGGRVFKREGCSQMLLCSGPWLGAREMVITIGPPKPGANLQATFLYTRWVIQSHGREKDDSRKQPLPCNRARELTML